MKAMDTFLFSFSIRRLFTLVPLFFPSLPENCFVVVLCRNTIDNDATQIRCLLVKFFDRWPGSNAIRPIEIKIKKKK